MYVCAVVITTRFISFAVILSLLLSLVLPARASAHACWEDAVVVVVSDAHLDDHRHGSSDHDHYNAHRHDDSTDPHDHSTGTNDLSRNAVCCNDGSQSQHATVDVPLLPPSQKATFVTFAAVVACIVSSGLLRSESSVNKYKIGSSPPYLADISRHTYLRTTTLLI